MAEGFAALPYDNQDKCEVCGCTINFADALLTKDLDYSVCRSFDCGRVMQLKSTMTPELFSSHLKFHQKLEQQRRAKQAATQRHIKQVTEQQQQQHESIRQSILQDNPDIVEDELHLVVIPSGLQQQTPLAQERVDTYIEHLTNIIQQAAEHNSIDDIVYDQHHDAHQKLAKVEQTFARRPEIRTLSDRLCSMCKGGCCAAGGEHAYLSVVTIKRYMDAHTELSQADILDLYVSRIQPETIDASCINQTAYGCALPRELRSDICNGFYCDTLKSCQKTLAATRELVTTLVIQRSSTHWNWFEPGIDNEVVQVVLIKPSSIME